MGPLAAGQQPRAAPQGQLPHQLHYPPQHGCVRPGPQPCRALRKAGSSSVTRVCTPRASSSRKVEQAASEAVPEAGQRHAPDRSPAGGYGAHRGDGGPEHQGPDGLGQGHGGGAGLQREAEGRPEPRPSGQWLGTTGAQAGVQGRAGGQGGGPGAYVADVQRLWPCPHVKPAVAGGVRVQSLRVPSPRRHNAARNIPARAGLPSAPVPARGTGAAAWRGAIPWGTPTTREPAMPAAQSGIQVPYWFCYAVWPLSPRVLYRVSCQSHGWRGDRFRSLARSQYCSQFGVWTPTDATRRLARNSASARRRERRFRVESENPAVLLVCSPN